MTGARSRPTRLLFFGAGVVVAAVLSSASCKTPTQIVVDVQTDACDQVKTTELAVASSEAALAEKGEPQASVVGCVSREAGKIGTLVLLPEGDENKEVVFRVVTGITKPAAECRVEGEAGCIFAKRRARFVENAIVSVLVVMSTRCAGIACGPGTSCNEVTGACESTPCVGAGCAPAPDDAGATDAPADVGAPPIESDAGCGGGTGCRGACVAGRCVVHCDQENPCGGPSPCQPGVPCDVHCDTGGACDGLTCGEASACQIHCKAPNACTGNFGCGKSAGACAVACAPPDGCAGNVVCSSLAQSTCQVACIAPGCAAQTVYCCGSRGPGCVVTAEFNTTPAQSACFK